MMNCMIRKGRPMMMATSWRVAMPVSGEMISMAAVTAPMPMTQVTR